ncbi:hypothetical protein KMZ15_03315 [Mycoavidus sp. HKI]|uniref:hypothetical protein n=1 Tax=Mycoavidus sp. HKI TaxID=2840467 RepID=UPI001CC002EE|nr:hypothetical protein [Mycoavidus sp. HKI]UAW64710.1 hypothetical protein KMZ15_03315 [Mycoavidus sp. HKI]
MSATFDTKAQAWAAKVEAEILAGKRTSEAAVVKVKVSKMSKSHQAVRSSTQHVGWGEEQTPTYESVRRNFAAFSFNFHFLHH